MKNKKTTDWELYTKYVKLIQKTLNYVSNRSSYKINEAQLDRLFVRGELELENACKNYDSKKCHNANAYLFTCLKKGIAGELRKIMEEKKVSLDEPISEDENGKVLTRGDMLPSSEENQPDRIYNNKERRILEQEGKNFVGSSGILPKKIFRRQRITRNIPDRLLAKNEIWPFVQAYYGWANEGTKSFKKGSKACERLMGILRAWEKLQEANRVSKKHRALTKKEMVLSEEEQKKRVEEFYKRAKIKK